MKSLKVIFACLALVFSLYVVLPNPDFPEPPPGSLPSTEPGDTNDPARRAYFTDFTRNEIMKHYTENFQLKILGFKVPVYRLNYPPEEAQVIIKDQARSSYLEEIPHPFRESIFVNGFEPKEAKDNIFVAGKTWQSKIDVKYVQSHPLPRFAVLVVSFWLFFRLVVNWQDFFVRLTK